MEKNHSSEATSHSASQEMPCVLWNPNVRYRIQKSLPPVPIFKQMNTFHNFPI